MDFFDGQRPDMHWQIIGTRENTYFP
jgi:hypothetical protein